jgi:hypothetical protein
MFFIGPWNSNRYLVFGYIHDLYFTCAYRAWIRSFLCLRVVSSQIILSWSASPEKGFSLLFLLPVLVCVWYIFVIAFKSLFQLIQGSLFNSPCNFIRWFSKYFLLILLFFMVASLAEATRVFTNTEQIAIWTLTMISIYCSFIIVNSCISSLITPDLRLIDSWTISLLFVTTVFRRTTFYWGSSSAALTKCKFYIWDKYIVGTWGLLNSQWTRV